MITEEQPIFPTFECYTGENLHSFVKIETTLFSDRIYFRGVYSDFEHLIPLSKIKNVTYNDWREKLGLLAFKTLIPLLSIISVYTYYKVQNIFLSILTVFMILYTIHIYLMGELKIVIKNESLSLICNKSILRGFWD